MATFSQKTRTAVYWMLLSMVTSTVGQNAGLTLTTQPRSQTVKAGDTVSLECDISGTSNSVFVWRTYPQNNPTGTQIIRCNPTCEPTRDFPSSKYHQVGNYGLNITNVDWRDGATYTCNFVSEDVGASATLVVIEKLTATFEMAPPTLAKSPAGNNSMDMSMDTAKVATCTVVFGAPAFPTEDLRLKRMPHLQMIFDGITYNSNMTVSPPYQSEYTGSARDREYSLTLHSPPIAMTKQDENKVLTCTVTTIDPVYTQTESATFSMQPLTPWLIQIIIPGDRFTAIYVDDVLNCTVRNHTDAWTSWEQLHTDANETMPTIVGPSLVIKENMIGSNVWRCVAKNGEGFVKANRTFAFNVTAGPVDDARAAEEERRRIGLGVGLGIGLGVPVLIAVVVGIVLFMRHKKNTPRRAANGKPKPSPAAATTSTSGYAPLSTQKEPQPIYQPKTNAAPFARDGSPVPSEEPSLNQSGHGDIAGVGFKPPSLPSSRSNSNVYVGVERPMNASGQPRLDTSNSRAGGFADIGGGGVAGRPSVAYNPSQSQDSASAVSIPHSTSMRSSASSMSPIREPLTYRQPAPRAGNSTGV